MRYKSGAGGMCSDDLRQIRRMLYFKKEFLRVFVLSW